jgi:hypothetical protein
MSGSLGSAAMPVEFCSELRECRQYAEHCALKAQIQSDPQLRQDFLEMQQRWLSLARCYEFSERLEFLSDIETRNKEVRLFILDDMTPHHDVSEPVRQSPARVERQGVKASVGTVDG